MNDGFNALLKFATLLERQSDKNRKRPIKTVREVKLLLGDCLENYHVFEKWGDELDCYMVVDDKDKIVKIRIGV